MINPPDTWDNWNTDKLVDIFPLMDLLRKGQNFENNSHFDPLRSCFFNHSSNWNMPSCSSSGAPFQIKVSPSIIISLSSATSRKSMRQGESSYLSVSYVTSLLKCFSDHWHNAVVALNLQKSCWGRITLWFWSCFLRHLYCYTHWLLPILSSSSIIH